MATSSIFTNIKIDTPEKVAAFINAYEASERDCGCQPASNAPKAAFITNSADIRDFCSRLFKA